MFAIPNTNAHVQACTTQLSLSCPLTDVYFAAVVDSTAIPLFHPYLFPIMTKAAIDFDGGSSTTITIRDAWRGTTFEGTAHKTASKMRNCRWLNNIVGIGIFSFGKFTFRPAVFSSITISHTSPMPAWDPPSGLSYTASAPHRGIWILNSSVDLAYGASFVNTIFDHRYGILLSGSNLILSNMRFFGSTDDQMMADPLDGTDILATGCSMSISTCRFTNAQNTDIWSRSTTALTVFASEFINPKYYGVRCTQSVGLNSPISIAANLFTHTLHPFLISAIYIERPPFGPAAVNTSVASNTINMSGANGTKFKPIILVDILGKFPAKDIAVVTACTLNMTATTYRASGIRVSGMGDRYRIIGKNMLDWRPAQIPGSLPAQLTQVPAGIIARDLVHTNHRIIENEMVSHLNVDKSFLHRAIDLAHTPLQMALCDNIMNNTKYGIHTEGSLNTTTMKTNDLGSAYVGLFCRGGSALPNQDRFENVWTGAYGSLGAEYQGTPSFTIFYDPSPVIPNDVPQAFSPPDWFQQLAGSNGSCDTTDIITFSGSEGGLIDGSIAPDNSASNWDKRRELLYKLMYQPDIAANDTAAANYLAAQTNTSPWKFAHAQRLFDEAYTLPAGLQQAMQTQLEGYRFWTDSLRALHLLQQADTTTYDAGIAALHTAAAGHLTDAVDSLGQLRTQAAATVQTGLTAAANYASNLPDLEEYEGNLRNILRIGIREAQGDSLGESDYILLRNIAAQCIYEGGVSICRAPHWLPHQEAVENYLGIDWTAPCSSFQVSSAVSPLAPASPRILPNPADQQVQVTFPDGHSGRWALLDAYGKMWAAGEIAGTPLTIATHRLPAGIYLLTARYQNGTASAAKVNISH